MVLHTRRSRTGAIAWAVVVGMCLTAGAGENIGPPVRTPDLNVQAYVWNLKAIRERHIVMQQRDYSCGAAVLATVARYYWGDPATEEQFIEVILRGLTPAEIKDRVENGLSMTDLRNAAVALGYQAMMGERSPAQMLELKAPVIIRIKAREHEHFVVYRGNIGDRVFLADPIRGNVRLSFDLFLEQWTDGVILAMAKPDVAELPKNAPLWVRYHSPVQPELQPARRMLVLPR